MKRKTFKKIVNRQIKIKATEYLYNLKAKHTKTKDLTDYKFQSYFSSENLSNDNKKLLFHLRTRSTNTRANYKNKYKFDLTCQFCDDTSEQTDAHLLECPGFDKILAIKPEFQNARHEDIFDDNIEKQVKVTEVYKEIFKKM